MFEQAVVDQHGEHLLNEERIAFGGLGDPPSELLGTDRGAKEIGDQLVGLLVGERLDWLDRRIKPAPRGSKVEQVGAGHTHEQDRGVARPVGHVLDEIEESRLTPLDIVEHQHERASAGDRLEHPSDRPERLLGSRRVGHTHQLRDPLADDSLILLSFEDRADLRLDELGSVEVGQPGGLFHDLKHREVGDAFSVWKASATQDRCVAEAVEELLNQARLPYPRGRQDREQPARLVIDRKVEGPPQRGELSPTAHHRRSHAHPARRPFHHRLQPVSCDGLGLALQLEGHDRLGDHGLPHEPQRLSAQQDFPRPCGLLESRGNIHGVAGDDRLSGDGVAGNDRARIDADSNSEPHTVLALEILVQRDECIAHIGSRTHGTQGVVFMEDRDAEHGHHGVADELLDGADVALDRDLHLLEVPRHHTPKSFRIQALPKRR
ncbi:MAG TPA: hypothetical protein VGL16_02805 [Actinomycetota bacterium]